MTANPDRFTTLPDEAALRATVVALEEHGFSVEVIGDLDAARQAVRAGPAFAGVRAASRCSIVRHPGARLVTVCRLSAC
jgi:hypothetical protein